MTNKYPLWAHCCFAVQDVLRVSFGTPPARGTPHPGAGLSDTPLSAAERDTLGQLMRINHVGEVCAQALYLAKARQTASPERKQQFLEAAQEERDHLIWTADVLDNIQSHRSHLNPLWYGGAYALGTIAGACGDGWSLGFMAETERQVAEHLNEHLARLPAEAHQSRAVLTQMAQDEAAHAEAAAQSGAYTLPWPVPQLMRLAAQGMKVIAARC